MGSILEGILPTHDTRAGYFAVFRLYDYTPLTSRPICLGVHYRYNSQGLLPSQKALSGLDHEIVGTGFRPELNDWAR